MLSNFAENWAPENNSCNFVQTNTTRKAASGAQVCGPKANKRKIVVTNNDEFKNSSKNTPNKLWVRKKK